MDEKMMGTRKGGGDYEKTNQSEVLVILINMRKVPNDVHGKKFYLVYLRYKCVLPS